MQPREFSDDAHVLRDLASTLERVLISPPGPGARAGPRIEAQGLTCRQGHLEGSIRRPSRHSA